MYNKNVKKTVEILRVASCGVIMNKFYITNCLK